MILLVWSIVVFLTFDNHESNKNDFLNIELKRFEGEIQSTLITYESFSNYIFDGIKDNCDILSIINQANFSSSKEKVVLRNKLNDILYRQYEDMKKYEFRQFHFHLPNTESFLRVHSPTKYGDLLSSVRESVRIVNEKVEYISGFEEGRIFNGFRHVYPLEYKNNHIGSVEISVSSASIVEVLSKLFDKEDFYFIIDKTAVHDKVFNEQEINYKNSLISEDYYVDKEVDDITSGYSTIIPKDNESFYLELKENYSEKLREGKSFIDISNFDGKDYIIKFSAIENFKKESIAYFISISESFVYKRLVVDMYKQITLISILAIFIIGVGFIFAIHQKRLKDASEIDYLTKIYNRSKFYEIVQREGKRSKRYKDELSIMMMDIDHFKNINDTYGHEWGDKVLKEMAFIISKNIRETDVFARWGGEEFVVMLPNTNKTNAIYVAEKIRKLIDECNSEKLKEITLSIGVSTTYSDNYDVDTQIKLADRAMYVAKQSGRNQVCYSESKEELIK